MVLTAYSKPMARLIDSHVDIILVGDSVGMVLYGMENTLGVDLEMMIRHGQAVSRGRKSALLVVDMPYGTYEDTPQQAYESAARVIEETECDAVKLEGGQDRAETIAYLTARDIPVMGHIGLQPQQVVAEGGYKIKGRTADSVEDLIADAKALEAAGVFSFVHEGTVEDAARKITAAVNIPSIGIGASPACDGQVLVTEDMLGLSGGYVPKFARVYHDISPHIITAVKTYAAEVKQRKFPSEKYLYK